jgi:hypothetical protein
MNAKEDTADELAIPVASATGRKVRALNSGTPLHRNFS